MYKYKKTRSSVDDFIIVEWLFEKGDDGLMFKNPKCLTLANNSTINKIIF